MMKHVVVKKIHSGEGKSQRGPHVLPFTLCIKLYVSNDIIAKASQLSSLPTSGHLLFFIGNTVLLLLKGHMKRKFFSS